MNLSRRDVVKAAAALPLAGLVRAAANDKMYLNGVRMGVQTYSFHDILNDGKDHSDSIVQKMQACGLYSCELFAPQIEPGAFLGRVPLAADCAQPFHGCGASKGGSARNPWAWEFQYPPAQEKEALRAKQKQWRETVPLDYFRAIRKKFDAAGIEIFSYNPMIYADSSDLEIDRLFQMAKALGCKAVNVSTTSR